MGFYGSFPAGTIDVALITWHFFFNNWKFVAVELEMGLQISSKYKYWEVKCISLMF